jgi:predicted enzyme related to lactoylglutathione lyase
MPNTHHRINYIELNVTNITRAKQFYGAAFGWTFTDYGPAYCEFNDGQMKGGFALAEKTTTSGGPLVILYTDHLEDLQESVKKHGAKITQSIYSFPGGRRFHFQDPEGYELAVWSER